MGGWCSDSGNACVVRLVIVERANQVKQIQPFLRAGDIPKSTSALHPFLFGKPFFVDF
jgi:hypothetical protein